YKFSQAVVKKIYYLTPIPCLRLPWFSLISPCTWTPPPQATFWITQLLWNRSGQAAQHTAAQLVLVTLKLVNLTKGPQRCDNVKCSQKTVKDAYYIICKPCSLQLEICCKCGKKEEIVIPLNSHEDKEEDDEQKKKRRGRGKKDLDDLDSDDDYNDDDDDDDDLSDLRGDDGDKGADLESDSEPKKQQNGSDVLPDVSTVSFKD
uniref:Chromosome 9 open reading frame 85 n=1 Tax=Gasterosteus aculeatus aculeatus TaxID=481459 RepID=A0AAQ4RLF1_GASAC